MAAFDIDIDETEAEEKKEPEKIEIDNDAFVKYSLTKNNITDFGLSFFFDVCKDLVISREFIEALYRVIIKIARTELDPIRDIPEMPGPNEEGVEPTEEEKAEVQK